MRMSLASATDVLKRSISDIQQGLNLPVLYFEAIVDATNLTSRRVSEKVLSHEAAPVTEDISGKAAFRHMKRVT